MGRLADAARLQRPGRRRPSTARRSASATSAAPRTARKEQRSLARLNGVPDGHARDPPPVRRQHRRGDRGRQGRTSPRSQPQLPAGREARGHPRPVALHLRRAARDQRPPGAGQHPGLPGRAGVHAELALDASSPASPSRPRSSRPSAMMWALDFTLNSVTMLALVLMVGIVIDDAIVVLENIFRFVEEKKMTPFEAARDGDGGDRAGGAGDDALASSSSSSPSRSCRASPGGSSTSSASPPRWRCMVSLLVSFTLTPMMSARLLRAEDAARRPRRRRGELAQRLLRLARPRLRAHARASSMRHRLARRARRAARDRARRVPLYRLVQAGVRPERRRRGRVRGQRRRRREGTSLAAMDEAMQRGRGRSSAAMPRRAHRARRRRAAASSAASTRAASTSASRRTRSARSRSAALWREPLARRPAGARSAATTPSAT